MGTSIKYLYILTILKIPVQARIASKLCKLIVYSIVFYPM